MQCQRLPKEQTLMPMYPAEDTSCCSSPRRSAPSYQPRNFGAIALPTERAIKAVRPRSRPRQKRRAINGSVRPRPPFREHRAPLGSPSAPFPLCCIMCVVCQERRKEGAHYNRGRRVLVARPPLSIIPRAYATRARVRREKGALREQQQRTLSSSHVNERKGRGRG